MRFKRAVYVPSGIGVLIRMRFVAFVAAPALLTNEDFRKLAAYMPKAVKLDFRIFGRSDFCGALDAVHAYFSIGMISISLYMLLPRPEQ